MDSITSFYNNLFAIEIAVFGIIAAAIFVFLQIVYSQFSYREVYGIFKNVFLLLFLTTSIATLLLTAAGSLLLSFPEFNPILGTNLVIKDILRDWVMAFSLLFSFLLSLALFTVFTFTNISYIRPSRVALLISKKMSKEQIRDYLLKKYGIPAPDDWLFLLRKYGGGFITVRSTEPENDEKHELSEEERAQKESKKQELEKELSENRKTYEKVKKIVEHAQDQMEPLDALMLRAINNVDLATINEIQSVLIRKSADFIGNYKDDEDSKEWNPYSGIIQKYLRYLTELLRTHLDMCDRQKLDSTKLKILETSEKIANQVISTNSTQINIILTFWKEIADNAIGRSREIFNKVVQQYRSLADYAFEKGIENNKNWLDEIFRHFGWLGERLITREGIEEKPLMRDYDYFNEYDQLFEALLSFRHEYNDKYPTSYPLIYFDAIDVVFRQITSTCKETQSRRLYENIFDCLYTYSSFAEAAIPKGNSNGAALAASRLKQGHEKLVNEGLEESAKEAIGLLVRMGGAAARHRDKLEKVDFLSNKPIDEYVMDILDKSPLRDHVISEVRESYLHMDSDRSFMVEMGRRLETNFGFMFDWTTGESYPDNDPRRR